MRTFFKFIKNLILFIIAPFFGLFLTPFNVLLVFAKDWRKGGFKYAVNGIGNYFYESAYRTDVFYCTELRTLWNFTLKTKEGKPFGRKNKSVSRDLGVQERDGTMSRTGAVLNCILFLLERNHCRKALEGEV